jgi:hypothetical protein
MSVRKLARWAFLATVVFSSSALFSAPAVAQNEFNLVRGVNIPQNSVIYSLSSDNSIYVLRPGTTQYVRMGRIAADDGGNVIGIDFRPADRSQTDFYALTDRGNLYLIKSNQASNGIIVSIRISSMATRFTGGYTNVMDFNPVANALRVTGSNEQNLAVVNGPNGQNLATTVAQTTFAYTAGDVNAGTDPEIVGGAYTNNFAGATTTLFFMIDHDNDTLVTIADRTATGSSNTGGGRLQTVGSLVLSNGTPFNASPTVDFDIFTDNNGTNFLVGQSGRQLFSIDLGQVSQNLPLGTTQRIVVNAGPLVDQAVRLSPVTGGVFDLAIPARQ